jgi:FkbM family methyltransferase
MRNSVTRFLNRFRENYYFSRVVSSGARPLHRACSWWAKQLSTKVRRNGVSLRLPNGKTMKIARDGGIQLASALFWHGLAGHEPDTSQTLLFFFERSAVFVDVGANYGLYSLLAALWNPSIRVVAFEPLLPIFENLKKNVALNGLVDRIVCENVALANNSGRATLYLPASEGKDLESTGTLSSNSWQVRKHAQPVQVTAMRFDDYAASHPAHVDIIKIDVEDFEADVLRGMAKVIQRDRPFIVCEILPRNREHKNERTRQVIEDLGYTPYWITPSGYIRVSRFDFERHDTNFLLSPVALADEILTDLAPLWHLSKQKAESDVA